MFQFRFSFNFSFGQSKNERLRELTEKLEEVKLENDKRYQQLQASEEKQKTEIAELREYLGEVKAERNMYKAAYEKRSEKYSALSHKYVDMKKANHRLQWEKDTMDSGIRNTFFVTRKWTERNISRQKQRHPYKGYQPTKSDEDSEDEW